jgi:replicative DNA helicase
VSDPALRLLSGGLDDAEDRRPVYSPDSEQQILVQAIYSRGGVARARASGIEEKHFLEVGNRRIWTAICAVADSPDEELSATTVIEWLRARGWLERAGGAATVKALDDTPHRGPLRTHVAVVLRLWRVREVMGAAQLIAVEPYGDIGDPDEWLAAVPSRLSDAAQTSRVQSIASFADTLKISWEALTAARGARGGYPTGIEAYDAVAGGLHPGEILLVSAKEKAGKSVLVGQWLAHVSALPVRENGKIVKRGRAAVIFALDAAKSTDWAERIASAHALVDLETFRLGTAIEADRAALLRGIEHATKLPVYVDAEHVASIGRMGARVRGLREELAADGIDLCAVAIDYIQLAAGEGRTREEQISSAMRGVVALAKLPDLKGISWTVISQTNTDGDIAQCKALAQMCDSWIHLTVDEKVEEVTWDDTARGVERVPLSQARIEVRRARRGAMGIRAKPIPLWCCYKFTFFYCSM